MAYKAVRALSPLSYRLSPVVSMPFFMKSSKKIPEVVDERPYRQISRGDFVIRCSDGSEFHLDKCIMANASLVFADMFSLPCPCTPPDDGKEKPIVDVTESGAVWEHLLSFCYLRVDELFLPLDDIRALLEAAKKYQMDVVTKWLRRTLLRPDYVRSQTLSVYALACAYDMADVARVAARGCLDLPADLGKAQGLELISALQYTRLLDYRQRCAAAAVQAVAVRPVPTWMSACSEWLGRCATCLEQDGCQFGDGLCSVRDKARFKVMAVIRMAWFKYFEALAEQLKTKPLPHVAKSPMLLGVVVASVTGCEQCRLHILDQATKFSDVVAERIERAICQVEVEN
ncbi:hypothetical protein OH77DRAFT_1588207 [Trametes cingulata]|nr:hypothetical protein OH77DRAFT_1588207 [Trametes cingulata]